MLFSVAPLTSDIKNLVGKMNAEYKHEMLVVWITYSLHLSIMLILKENELWLRSFVMATATKQTQYSEVL